MREHETTPFNRAAERSRKAKKTELFDRFPAWIFTDIRRDAERLRNSNVVMMDIETKLANKYELLKSEIRSILELDTDD